MSYDFVLTDDKTGETIFEANYTYNISTMVWAACQALGLPVVSLNALHGMSGPDGARLCHFLAIELDIPDYDQFNPANGWGGRESLVELLIKMRDAVPERHCTWRVS